MAFWCYRVFRTETKMPSGGTDICHTIRTTWFDTKKEKNTPTSYGGMAMPPCGETVDELRKDLKNMLDSLKKPVLSEKDFPGENNGN